MPRLYRCVICYLEMYLGFPEEGLAQCFSYLVTLMFVSKSRQKGRPVALAAVVPSGSYKKGCGYTPAYLEVSWRNTPGCKTSTDDKFGGWKNMCAQAGFLLRAIRKQAAAL